MGFPFLILAIAALAAIAMRRKYGDSPLVFFLSWVITDGLLTLAVYGVNLLGTF